MTPNMNCIHATNGVCPTCLAATHHTHADAIEAGTQALVARLAAQAERIAALEVQAATLRAWMAEYHNDKYTGAWWLAEFDRICIAGKARHD
jgi:hypothetical protein